MDAGQCGFLGKIDPADEEASALLPRPAAYDVPTFARCKVHRDYHIEIGKALYSIPKVYIGQYVDVRADLTLVKVFWHGDQPAVDVAGQRASTQIGATATTRCGNWSAAGWSGDAAGDGRGISRC